MKRKLSVIVVAFALSISFNGCNNGISNINNINNISSNDIEESCESEIEKFYQSSKTDNDSSVCGLDNNESQESFHIEDENSELEYPIIQDAKIGDIIVFGAYEQDNIVGNGKEDIQWIVLDKQDDKIFVISKFLLDSHQYNESKEAVTWETCSLRAWLNDDFLREAFSPAQQSEIVETVVKTEANPQYSVNPGNDTVDKLFLLSIYEVTEYFAFDSERVCKATQYARSNCTTVVSSNEYSGWWLRTPGRNEYGTSEITAEGSISNSIARAWGNMVRPAMWISID